MKTIEEEIKQKSFASIYTKSHINVIFTAGWLNKLFCKQIKPFGISTEQYNVLRILRGQHPKSVMLNQITDRMIDKMSNATRLVEKLKHKDLVTREINPDNRRQVNINITEKGLALLAEIDVVIKEDQKPPYIHSITEDELHQLNYLLDKLRS